MTNPMRTIKVEKLTLNFGAGKDQKKLEKGVKLIKLLTGKNPVTTKTEKRIPGWSLRPGLPIGCKLTLRGKEATNLIKKFLLGKDNELKKTCFDNNGNISFGIHEYIDIPNVEYSPEIGVIGFQLSISLERPGFRIKNRKIKTKKIPKHHSITKEDSLKFMKEEFSVKLIGENNDL